VLVEVARLDVEREADLAALRRPAALIGWGREEVCWPVKVAANDPHRALRTPARLSLFREETP
jgi:hypothetical protein